MITDLSQSNLVFQKLAPNGIYLFNGFKPNFRIKPKVSHIIPAKIETRFRFHNWIQSEHSTKNITNHSSSIKFQPTKSISIIQ